MNCVKYTVYIIDFEDYGAEEYKVVMEQHRHLSGATVFIEGIADIGEWDDYHELNLATTTRKQYEGYFKNKKAVIK